MAGRSIARRPSAPPPPQRPPRPSSSSSGRSGSRCRRGDLPVSPVAEEAVAAGEEEEGESRTLVVALWRTTSQSL